MDRWLADCKWREVSGRMRPKYGILTQYGHKRIIVLRLLIVVLAAFSHLSYAETPNLDSLKSAYVQTISFRDAAAVISLDGMQHIAKQGELVFDQYRVKQVQENYIVIESDKTVLRLFPLSTVSKSRKPPEIFYRQIAEEPTYEAVPHDKQKAHQGEMQ